eukprot:Hpha_TRINITY_DN4883_c0_g1::TRINITY_DN4883_c0_g1_i2::g.20335::m.20335
MAAVARGRGEVFLHTQPQQLRSTSQTRTLSPTKHGDRSHTPVIRSRSERPRAGRNGTASASQYAVGRARTSGTVDLLTSNIIVTSVELAERERVTQSLRHQVGTLGRERGHLQKQLAEMKAYVQKLETKLTAGGLTAAYARLDAKYQTVRRRLVEWQEMAEDATTRGAVMETELSELRCAVELRADDLGRPAEELLEIARGGLVKQDLLNQLEEANSRASQLEEDKFQAEKRIVELESEVALSTDRCSILEQWVAEQQKRFQGEDFDVKTFHEEARKAQERESRARSEVEYFTRRLQEVEKALSESRDREKAAEERTQALQGESQRREDAERQLLEAREQVSTLQGRVAGSPVLEDSLREEKQQNAVLRRQIEAARKAAAPGDLQQQVEELRQRLGRAEEEGVCARRERVELQREYDVLQSRFRDLVKDVSPSRQQQHRYQDITERRQEILSWDVLTARADGGVVLREAVIDALRDDEALHEALAGCDPEGIRSALVAVKAERDGGSILWPEGIRSALVAVKAERDGGSILWP